MANKKQTLSDWTPSGTKTRKKETISDWTNDIKTSQNAKGIKRTVNTQAESQYPQSKHVQDLKAMDYTKGVTYDNELERKRTNAGYYLDQSKGVTWNYTKPTQVSTVKDEADYNTSKLLSNMYEQRMREQEQAITELQYKKDSDRAVSENGSIDATDKSSYAAQHNLRMNEYDTAIELLKGQMRSNERKKNEQDVNAYVAQNNVYEKQRYNNSLTFDAVRKSNEYEDLVEQGNDIPLSVLQNSFAYKATKEQLDMYRALSAKDAQDGTDNAKKYLNYVTRQWNAEATQDITKVVSDFADKAPVLASAGSVVAGIGSGIGYLNEIANSGLEFGGENGLVSLKPRDGGIDTNNPYYLLSNIKRTARNTVSQNIIDSVNAQYEEALASDKLTDEQKLSLRGIRNFGGNALNFLYQTGMSMADFLTNAAITGGAGGGAAEWLSLSVMGSSAASDALIDAKDRGLDDTNAMYIATIGGLAEIVTEKVSIDALINSVGKKGFARVIANAIPEGTEEVASDFINLFADVVVNGDKSEWERKFKEYSRTMNEERAYGKVVTEQLLDSGLSFLGGALSGGVMGAFDAGQLYTREQIEAIGKEIKETEKSDPKVYASLVNDLAPEGSYAQKVARSVLGKEELTDYDVGNLYVTGQDMFDNAKKSKKWDDKLAKTSRERRMVALTGDLGENGKDFFASAFKGQEVTSREKVAFNQYYEVGLTGGTFQDVPRTKDTYGAEITEQQATMAFTAGQQDALMQKQSAMEKLEKRKANGFVAPAKVGVTYNENIDKSTFTTEQRSQFTVLDALGKSRGVAIVIDPKSETENAYWDSNGTLHIHIDATKNAYLQFSKHELTHMAEEWAVEEYDEYKNFILSTFRKNNPEEYEAVKADIASLYNANGEHLSYAKLERELVAQASEALFTNEETISELVSTNRPLAVKVKDAIHRLSVKFDALLNKGTSSGANLALKQGADFLKEAEAKFTKMLNKASENMRIARENATEETEVEETSMHLSMKSLANGTGFDIETNSAGEFVRLVDKNGKEVKHVTPEMIENTPISNIINKSLEVNKQVDVNAEKKFIADMLNLIIEKRDSAMVWAVAGSQIFSAIKKNSDKQYNLTIDFSTICKKTQAIVDAMSGVMKKLGRGLTRAEVEKVYLEVGRAGETTPCPVCYVFSRWMGVGGILDQIDRFQAKYVPSSIWSNIDQSKYGKHDNISDGELIKMAEDIEKEVIEFGNKKAKKDYFDANGNLKLGKVVGDLKTFYSRKGSKAIKSIADNANTKLKVQEYDTLIENTTDAKELKKLRKQRDKVADKIIADESAFEQAFKESNDDVERIEAFQWMNGTVLNKDKNGNWHVNKDFVPVTKDILFDLNKGAEFASEFPESWKYRTTRGAAAGKAIVPYSDARVGETIQGISSGDVNKIRVGEDINEFLNGDYKKADETLENAREKMFVQNLIGGMRYQSTSDFRYEYASDYLMTFLEMQALGANVQLYTKVIEAVDFFASVGADVNCSVMPLGDGFITENGVKKLVYSPVTGINKEAAMTKVHQYDNVQLILVGISDEHIRLALGNDDVTFVIPFHGSGNTVHQIQVLMNLLGEDLDVVKAQDYTKVQSDHNDPNATTEQKSARALRKKIISGNAHNLTQSERNILNRNEFLNDLYDRFYNRTDSDEYHHFITSSDTVEQIFPYEYWDKNSTYETANVNGQRFVDYCKSLGILPRFSGHDSSGRYLGFGDFVNDDGYWKLLIDRRMYKNTYDKNGNWTGYGEYRDQSKINVSDFNVSMIDEKNASETYGEAMSKRNDPKKTNGIVENVYEQIKNSGNAVDGETLTDVENKQALSTARDVEPSVRTYSRKTTVDGFTYIKADRNVIKHSDADGIKSDVYNFLSSIIGDTGYLILPTDDGVDITITSEKSSERHTTQGKLSSYDEFLDEYGNLDDDALSDYLLKARASVHIDEIIRVVDFNNANFEQNIKEKHENDAVNGWKYPRFFFMDIDGDYYRVTLSIMLGENGEKTAYNLGRFEKRRSPAIIGSSLSGAPLSETSNGTLPQTEASVKTKSLKEDTLRTLATENERLQRANEELLEQFKLSPKGRLNQKSLRTACNKLVKEYDSTMDVEELMRSIDDASQQFANDEPQRAMSTLKSAATELLKSQLDETAWQESEPMRNYLKSSTLRISPDTASELSDRFGTYGEYRNSVLKDFKLSLQSGVSPMEVLSSLRENYPEYFSDSVAQTELDAVMEIDSVIQSLKPTYRNSRYTSAEEINFVADELLETYFQIEDQRTFADKNKEKLKQTRERFYREMAELRKEKNAKMNDIRADRDAKIKDIKNRYRQMMKTNAEKREETRKRNVYRKSIKKNLKDIESWILRPTREHHIPYTMKTDVTEFLNGIRVIVNGSALNTEKLANALDKLNEQIKSAKWQELVGDIIPPDFNEELGALAQSIRVDEQKAGENGVRAGKKIATVPLAPMTINEMNSDRLRMLAKTIAVLKHCVNYENFRIASGYKITADEASNGINEYLDGIKNRKRFGEAQRSKLDIAQKMLKQDMLSPVSYFDTLGDTGNTLFDMLNRSEEDRVFKLEEAMRFFNDYVVDGIDSKVWKSWTAKNADKTDFKLESGETVSMTPANLIDLYLLNNRQQAQGHIYGTESVNEETGEPEINGGGIVLRDSSKVYKVTQADVEKILSTMTAEMYQVADRMQEFMQTTAEWGNKANMDLYGWEDQFGEDFYWNIETQHYSQQNALQKGRNDGRNAVKNYGWTKALTTNANSPILVRDAFDVFARHVGQSARYGAYLRSLTTMNRVFNNIRGNINDTFGYQGDVYLDNLLMDLNGTRNSESEGYVSSLVPNAKVAALGFNASVALQQPFSIVRATALQNPKFLLKAFGTVTPSALKTATEEMQKYSYIAKWKSWGMVEQDMGRSLKAILTGSQTLGENIREKSMWLIGKGDEVAWRRLWIATRLEVAEANSELDTTSDAFFKKVADRFNEIVTKTQVADGILQRNDMQRTTSSAVKLSTTFMSEIYKTYDMLASAFRDVYQAKQGRASKSGAKKKLAQALGAWLVTLAINAAVKGLVGATRDKDDEKKDEDGNIIGARKFSDKFGDAFLYEIVDNINPFSMIPFIRDVSSELVNSALFGKTYSNDRMDMTVLSDFTNVAKQVFKWFGGDDIDSEKALNAGLKLFSDVTGVSIYNIKRAVTSITGTATTLFSDTQKGDVFDKDLTLMQRFEAAKLNYDVTETQKDGSFKSSINKIYYDLMYEAQQNGDLDTYGAIEQYLLDNGRDQQAINTALGKRETDSDKAEMTERGTVTSAVTYLKNKDLDGYIKTVEDMKNTYDEDAVDSMIKAEYGIKSDVLMEELFNAYQSGDKKWRKELYDYIKDERNKTDNEMKNLLQNVVTRHIKQTDDGMDILNYLEEGDYSGYAEARKRLQKTMWDADVADIAIQRMAKEQWKDAYIDAVNSGDQKEAYRIKKLFRGVGIDADTLV